MKKLLFALIILVIWFIFAISMFDNIQVSENNFILVPIIANFLSILGYYQGEKAKIFDLLYSRLFYLILIILNTITFIISTLLPSSFTTNIQYVIISTIMLTVMISIIVNFFKNQISIDLTWYHLRINPRMSLSKANLKEMVKLIDETETYCSKVIDYNNDFYEYGRLSKIISKLCKNIINIEYNDIENRETIKKALKKILSLYSLIYRKSGVSENYRDEIIKSLLESLSDFYNREYVEYFKIINKVCLSIIEYEFSNEPLNETNDFPFFSVLFINRIKKVYKESNSCNQIIDKSLEEIIIYMNMYDFNLSEKSVILNIQELIFTIMSIKKQSFSDEVKLLDFLQKIVYLLHTQCIPRKLHLFYRQMIYRISKEFEYPQNARIQELIFNIILDNEYDKAPIIYLVKNYAELIQKDSDIEKTYTYFDLISKIDTDQLYLLSLNSFFDYSITFLKEDERKRFAENTFRKILNSDDKANYLFFELRKYSENTSVENMFMLIDMLFSQVKVRGQKSFHNHIYTIFDRQIENVLSENLRDSSIINKNLKKIIHSLDTFTAITDSDYVTNFTVNIMADYLDNHYAKNLFIERIMEIGYIAIEQGNSVVYRNVSNKLGWHIHEQISKKEKNERDEVDQNWISKVFKHLINFYVEVKNFQINDALFVGTAIVVNLTHLNRLKVDVNSNAILLAFYKELSNKLFSHYESLDASFKRELSKSARIRKYSINHYVKGDFEENKKIINSIFNIDGSAT